MATAVMVIVGLALVVIGLLAWLVYEQLIRPRQPYFKGKNIHLWLDLTQKVCHIESGAHAFTKPLTLGGGQFEFRPLTEDITKKTWVSGSPDLARLDAIGRPVVTRGSDGYLSTTTKTVSTGQTLVTIDEIDPVVYFYQRWQTDPKYSSGKRLVSLDLPSSTARALKRWVNAHRRELTPDKKALRKRWSASCQTLLDGCRRHPSVQALKKPLELSVYTDAPAIRYLAIGHDGQVCVKRASSSDVHTLSFDRITSKGDTLSVPCPDGATESFTLSTKDIERLHRIRRLASKTSAQTAHVA
jgi:hypothetical protein